MDPASMAALTEQLGSDSDGVFEINVPIVAAFLWVTTQWRTGLQPSGLGFRTHWIGLDYQGVSVALTAADIPLTGELLAGLQAMEHAAIAALNAGE